jgi:hypothetical protein
MISFQHVKYDTVKIYLWKKFDLIIHVLTTVKSSDLGAALESCADLNDTVSNVNKIKIC